MFIAPASALLSSSLREAFRSGHPEPDMQNLYIDLEYPIRREEYPAIWVGFSPQGQIKNMGVGNKQILETDEGYQEYSRWQFTGSVSFTCMAMSSLQRARIADAVTSIIMQPKGSVVTNPFREAIANNALIPMQPNWDQIQVRGQSETPGTPWGTDDVVYEITLSMDVIGEFSSVNSEAPDSIATLSDVTIIANLEPGGIQLDNGGWI